MAEAVLQHDGRLYEVNAGASYTLGQVCQMKDGRAGFAETSITSGDPGEFRVEGVARIAKTASIVLLEGDEIYWDHSANTATYKPVNDRDFYVGSCVEDCTSTQTYVDVALNQNVRWNIDIDKHGFFHVPIGTAALNTAGIFRRGGVHDIFISSTSEAQKQDMLSIDGFATGANAIIEGCFTVVSDGAGTNTDVSIGVANGTNATDADSITESIFIHLNGNSTTIYAESDDGTVEVAATDTTTTYTEGAAVANRVYFTMDMRNPADVQIYINRVLVLDGTTFNVNAAVGPWFLLCHVEKTSSADTYNLTLHHLRARLGEQ